MSQRNSPSNPWKAAGLVGVMGLDMAVCILAGYYLASRFGQSRLMVAIGVLVGIAVGIVSCVLLLKKFLEDIDG